MEFHRWIFLLPFLCAYTNGISRSFTTNETTKIKQAQNAGEIYRNFKQLKKTNPVSTTTPRPIMSREDLKSYNSNKDNKISSKGSYTSSNLNKHNASNRTFRKRRPIVNSDPWYEGEPRGGQRNSKRGRQILDAHPSNQYKPSYNRGFSPNNDKSPVYNAAYNRRYHRHYIRNDRVSHDQPTRRKSRNQYHSQEPPAYNMGRQNMYHNQPRHQQYDPRYNEPPPHQPPPPPPYRRRLREPHYHFRGRTQNFPRDRRPSQRYRRRDSYHPSHRNNNMKPPPSYFENAGPPPPPPTPPTATSPPLPPTPHIPLSHPMPRYPPKYVREARRSSRRIDRGQFASTYYSGKNSGPSKPPRIHFREPSNRDSTYDYRPPPGRGPERRLPHDPYYDPYYRDRYRHEPTHYISPPTTMPPPTPPGFLFRIAEDLDIL